LMREARALELSRGTSVVDVVDAGLVEEEPYVALEMLDGRGLDSLLTTRRRLPTEQAVGIALGVCDGLASAHRAGVVHRDIKPSNVFLARRGDAERVVLIDFGIARMSASGPEPKLTRLGERPGTPEYMAPEQLLDGEVDHRADLFALALVLYECIAGEPAYPERETLSAVLRGQPPPALAAPKLDAFFVRALARDPATRPQTAQDFAAELSAAAGVKPSTLRVLDPPAAPSAESKRQFSRMPYVAPLRVVRSGGASIDGQTADLSEGGALGMLGASPPLETRVTLRFGLPISGRIGQIPAIVRWSRAARHGHAVGFEFVDAPAESLGEIRRFVTFTSDRERA